MDSQRRALLRAAAAALMIGAAPPAMRKDAPAIGRALPRWTPGCLDIHHIDTGLGNATFILAPDGTTILIDCGGEPLDGLPVRPSAARPAGEWVSRYALRHAAAAGRTTLDYAIATHIHPDHVNGLPTVDRFMPITAMIDRGFPHYAPLAPPAGPFADAYLTWLRHRAAAGRRVETIVVGSAEQLAPRRSAAFSVRAIAANGSVWTGTGTASRSRFADADKWTPQTRPNENECSIALLIECADFRYFTGGDLTMDHRDGAAPWLDIESAAAAVVGHVNVATADHHGYFDATGADFTHHLAADAYVIQAWHPTHPAPAQLQRMLGAWPGRTIKPVFATRLAPASQLINRRFLSSMKSTDGHVVVRVRNRSFSIVCTNSRDEHDTVTSVFHGA